VIDLAMAAEQRDPRVLHVVVGHGLPRYFWNAVQSVRTLAKTDSLLVIDNASPQQDLRTDLMQLGEQSKKVDVILRTTNDLGSNGKVGSLYSAYEIAFEQATSLGFDLVHLMQGDFQMMWWDTEFIRKSGEIFAAHPNCVNIVTRFMSRGDHDEFVRSDTDELLILRNYGLCDTGIYNLARLNSYGIRFGSSERDHAQYYLNKGLEVIWHPWPTDAAIPWPAVVRNGVQRGKEAVSKKPFLLKPLTGDQITRIKTTQERAWMEDFCIPWGWACLSPMWLTGIDDSIHYWVDRYRDGKKNGLRYLVPHVETRGIDNDDRRKLLRIYHYRPSVFKLIIVVPSREVGRRLREARWRVAARRPDEARISDGRGRYSLHRSQSNSAHPSSKPSVVTAGDRPNNGTNVLAEPTNKPGLKSRFRTAWEAVRCPR
jgi:hypothetical protein